MAMEIQLDEMVERFGLRLSTWDCGSSDFSAIESEVRRMVLEHGIRLRGDDAGLVQIHFSLPTSNRSVLVLGLRYRKRDGSFTEDHFLCSWQAEQRHVVPYYGRRLERALREHTGTHRAQVDLSGHVDSTLPEGPFTMVNTWGVTKVPK